MRRRRSSSVSLGGKSREEEAEDAEEDLLSEVFAYREEEVKGFFVRFHGLRNCFSDAFALDDATVIKIFDFRDPRV